MKKTKTKESFRVFSESFKRQRVEEYQNHLVTVKEISRAYKVSEPAIYKWISKFSGSLPKGSRQVVELESEARRTLEFSKRTEELEKMLGRKQIEIEFWQRMVKLASKELGTDIKKNFSGKL